MAEVSILDNNKERGTRDLRGETDKTDPRIQNAILFRWMRQHPHVLCLPWKASVKRAEKSNAVDILCSGVLGHEVSVDQWQQFFTEPVEPLSSVGPPPGLR